MTIKEAFAMLEEAPDDDTQSTVNTSMTTQQVLTIVVMGLAEIQKEHGLDHVLEDIMEKRVYQCVRNQRQPRY